MREEFKERNTPRGSWPGRKLKNLSQSAVYKVVLLCSAFNIKFLFAFLFWLIFKI